MSESFNALSIEDFSDDIQSAMNDFLSEQDLGRRRQTNAASANASFSSDVTKIEVPKGELEWSNFWGRYNLRTIEEISVVKRPFPPSQLQFIARNCPALKKLRLSNCLSDDLYTLAGLAMVGRGCRLIHTLHISNCPFQVAKYSNVFRGYRLRGRGFRTFPNLKSLTLSGERITDAVISRLVGRLWENIVNLGFAYSYNLTDAAVAHIGKTCKNLETLDLEECREIVGRTLQSLAGCPKLRSLDLGWTSVGNIDVQNLRTFTRGCTNLSRIILSGCEGITNADVAGIAACDKLVHVVLTGCSEITDRGVSALAGCPLLEILQLGSCEYVDGSSIISIADRCPNLKKLDLTRCRSLESGVLKKLAQCQRLESLDIQECVTLEDDECYTDIDDSGVIALAGCGSLRYLNISDNCKLTDACIIALARTSNVTVLDTRIWEVEYSEIRRAWQGYFENAQTFFKNVLETVSAEMRERMAARTGDSKRRRTELVNSMIRLRF